MAKTFEWNSSDEVNRFWKTAIYMYDTYVIILICSSSTSTSWTHNTLRIFHSENITDLLTYYSLIHLITFAPLSSMKLFLHCAPLIFFRRHHGSINLECFSNLSPYSGVIGRYESITCAYGSENWLEKSIEEVWNVLINILIQIWSIGEVSGAVSLFDMRVNIYNGKKYNCQKNAKYNSKYFLTSVLYCLSLKTQM